MSCKALKLSSFAKRVCTDFILKSPFTVLLFILLCKYIIWYNFPVLYHNQNWRPITIL